MENINFWLQAIISILSGILALIPLAVKLVQYVKAFSKEKNWNQALKLVMSLMAQAEMQFDNGADRKEFVLKELQAMANTLNFEIDWAVISDMIDTICDVSKKIN